MEFRGWTKQDVQRLRELMQEYGDNMGLMRLRGGTALQGRSPSDIQVMWKALQKKITNITRKITGINRQTVALQTKTETNKLKNKTMLV